MLFYVPLAYEVKGVPKGKRNETREQYWERFEIDIPVYDDERAPVAVEWFDAFPDPGGWLHAQDDWRKVQPVPPDGRQTSRLLDGEYYIRTEGGHTPESLAELFANPECTYFFNTGYIHHDKRDAERPVDRSSYREDKEYSSDRDSRYAYLLRAAGDLFIAGGEVYRRSSEPVVITTTFRSDAGTSVIPRIVAKDRVPVGEFMHSLDEYDEVLAKCVAIRQQFQREGLDPDDPARRPKVLIHHSTFDASAKTLVDVLNKYVDGTSDHVRLKQVEPRYGIAFLELRISLNAYNTQGGDLGDVVRATEELLTTLGNDYSAGKIQAALTNYLGKSVSADVGIRF